MGAKLFGRRAVVRVGTTKIDGLRTSFSIELDLALVPADEPVIRKLVNVVKPAYMHFMGIVQPVTPPVIDHWEVGYSEFDQDTDLH